MFSAVAGAAPCLHPHGHKGKCICQRCVRGVTLLRVFAPLQGGKFLTAHHGLFFVYFLQLLFSLLNNPLFAPCIIQAIKNPVSPLTLYLLHSSKNPISLLTIYPPAPIALFVKVSPGRACNDYNLTFLCWCEMTNLSATFFISQTFDLSLTDSTFVIWKHPVVIVETFKVKVYLTVFIFLHNPFTWSWCLHLLGTFLVACIWLGTISWEFNFTPIPQLFVKILKEYCAWFFQSFWLHLFLLLYCVVNLISESASQGEGRGLLHYSEGSVFVLR